MFHTAFELINTRSFPSLWYWIILAVSWSMAAHRVLGVPYDMIQRARRKGGEAAEDVVAMTRLCVRRLLTFGREGGVVMALVAPALLAGLMVLGFYYGFEFPQALALILGPMMLVGLLSLHTAGRLERMLLAGAGAEAVLHVLIRHRTKVQVIGMAAIVVTALWGMLHNVRALPFF